MQIIQASSSYSVPGILNPSCDEGCKWQRADLPSRHFPQARAVTEPGPWEIPEHRWLRLPGRFRLSVGASETARQDPGWHLPEPLQRNP